MKRFSKTVAIATTGLFLAACGGGSSSTTTTTTSKISGTVPGTLIEAFGSDVKQKKLYFKTLSIVHDKDLKPEKS